MTEKEKQVLMAGLDHMWLPVQSGEVAEIIASLSARKMLEPAIKQHRNAPAGAVCITEKGAKAMGYA